MFTKVAASAADASTLHAVLTDLLSEVAGEAEKSRNTTLHNSNWRTRQIVRELKELKSLPALFSSEEEVRGVVVSQEARCRVKILKAFLSGQYIVEEQSLLQEEEIRSRNFLTNLAFSLLKKKADWFLLIGKEMYERSCKIKDLWIERIHYKQQCDLEGLMVKEKNSRHCLEELQSINREEIERRRFLAVGREIDMEILRQKSYRMNSLAHFSSSKILLEMSKIINEEERDRCSLERLYLLKLSLIANDQENSIARLVVNSVMNASITKSKLNKENKLMEITSKLLLLPSKESEIRGIIERNEMEQRQKLQVNFFISWRTVFKRTMIPKEGTEILQTLELYERRCLFDQWRFGFKSLDEHEDFERRILVRRESERDIFFNHVVDSLTSLWKQEGEQFNNLRKLYNNFIWSERILKATTILDLEERCARKKIIESEIKESFSLRDWIYTHNCEEAAFRKARSIIMVENNNFISLKKWHKETVLEQLFIQLYNEEENLRVNIESEACNAWSDIILKEGSVQFGSYVNFVESVEYPNRSLLIEKERESFIYHKLKHLAFTELKERKIIEKMEFNYRIKEYMSILEYVESWNRLEIQTESQQKFLQIALCKLNNYESINRSFIEFSEVERCKFLFDSFDYNFPELRACEVDELNKRLDIINEAEIVIGALAYRHGMHCQVKYASDNLRLKHSVLHFISSSDLLKFRKIDLIQTVEPFNRRDIMLMELQERLVLDLEVKECKVRLYIEKSASNDYDNLQKLFDRIISRDDQWRTRGTSDKLLNLSRREELVDYFRRKELSLSSRLKEEREKTCKLLSLFFEEFYWGRDSIVLEEFVARESIINGLIKFSCNLKCVSSRSVSHVALRLYSLAMTTTQELKSLLIKVNDSLDNVGITCELREAQSISTAGNIFRVCFPVSQMEWIRPLTEKSNVVYFEARDDEGDLIATASLLIRSEDLLKVNGSTVVSVPLDNQQGKMNVILYVR